ncbi:MAG TPA: DMT family transporter [Methylomirabilota bacterium]
MPEASQTRAYVTLLAAVALWGSFPATAKLALIDFPPFFLAAVRCTAASCFLLVLLARSSSDTIRGLGPGAARAFLVLGAAGIWGSMQFTYLAIYNTTAGNAVILQAATPVIVALIARFYLGERLRSVQWLGVAASLVGVLLVITRGPFAMLQPAELHSGDFITLLSLSSWAIYTVYGKRVLASYSPLLATTAAYVMGTFLILLTAAVTAPLFPPPRLWSLTAWTIVFYQGILGAVAHIWWYEAVLVVGPSQAAIFTNLQPIIGIVLAPLLLGEQIGVWHVVGTLFVLAGVGLTTRPPSTTLAEPGRSPRTVPREGGGRAPGEMRNIESSDAEG